MSTKGREAVVIGIAMLIAALLAGPALGAEAGRKEYKAAVEPICRRNAQANERILAGVKAEVRHGKLKPAAAKFARAARELKKTLRQIKRVPRPAADGARLARWFAYVAAEAKLFAAAGRKLGAGDKPAAQHIVVKLTRNANRANLAVLPFGFHYCRLDPARFT